MYRVFNSAQSRASLDPVVIEAHHRSTRRLRVSGITRAGPRQKVVPIGAWLVVTPVLQLCS